MTKHPRFQVLRPPKRSTKISRETQSKGETPLCCPQPPGGWYRRGRARLFMEGHCKRTSGGRTKVQVAAKEIQTRYKEKNLSRSGQKWHRLPREAVGCPSLETFMFSLTLFSSRARPSLPECFI